MQNNEAFRRQATGAKLARVINWSDLNRRDIDHETSPIGERLNGNLSPSVAFIHVAGGKMGATMRLTLTCACIVVSMCPATAQQLPDNQAVPVGPWTITTTYKGDKFDNCSMARTTPGLGVTFVRAPDGLLLVLESPKWKLERGKAYSVQLVAGPRSTEAKALAELKGVTIPLADRSFNEILRAANFLDVRGAGATLRVPLDKSTAALDRLELCFEKNGREGPETNPFVAPTRKP